MHFTKTLFCPEVASFISSMRLGSSFWWVSHCFWSTDLKSACCIITKQHKTDSKEKIKEREWVRLLNNLLRQTRHECKSKMKNHGACKQAYHSVTWLWAWAWKTVKKKSNVRLHEPEKAPGKGKSWLTRPWGECKIEIVWCQKEENLSLRRMRKLIVHLLVQKPMKDPIVLTIQQLAKQ